MSFSLNNTINLWLDQKIVWSGYNLSLITECKQIVKPSEFKLIDLENTSKKFPIKFPIITCLIESQPKHRRPIIENQAFTAYPIIHEKVLWLYCKFLEYKKNYGSKIEQQLYQNMKLHELVQRLLDKRCVAFLTPSDNYLLINGSRGIGGFEQIGKETEKSPLIISECLSYDEMKLAALLSISSHSEFINNGNRYNAGQVEHDKSKIETEGVIMGLIGARFERDYVMESQDILITRKQNIASKGYGQDPSKYRLLWNEFYDQPSLLFTEVTDTMIKERKIDMIDSNMMFDNVTMAKRYAITFDTLLIESNERAKAVNKKAYIHVVGFGLGVWKVLDYQENIFLSIFGERIVKLLPKLKNISHIHFSWFYLEECGVIKNGNIIKSDENPVGITINLSKRNPADKLVEKNTENCLLIVTYAWDSNALPGNEFWQGLLSASGDPAAACSTLITELHNPHINTKIISGNNLHIATINGSIVHIADYAKSIC